MTQLCFPLPIPLKFSLFLYFIVILKFICASFIDRLVQLLLFLILFFSFIILYFLAILMSILTTHVIPCILICILLQHLSQSVTGPTHVHHDSSESTIDLVFVSEPLLLNTCDTTRPLSNSDHRGILMEPSQKSVKACKLIDEFNWDSVLSENIELSWELWHKQFMSVMAQSIPNRVIPTRRNLPWLNKSIVKLMRKRNQLFKKVKRTGNFRQFKLARNRTLAQFQPAKCDRI